MEILFRKILLTEKENRFIIDITNAYNIMIYRRRENKMKNMWWTKILSHPVVAGIVVAIIMAIATNINSNSSKISEVAYRIDSLETTMKEGMDDIKTDIKYVEDNVADIREDMQLGFKEVDDEIDDITKDIVYLQSRAGIDSNDAVRVIFLQDIKDEIIQSEHFSKEVTEYLSPPAWENSAIIAQDANSAVSYKAEELAGIPFLSYDKNENQETFFYGCFDVNNNWDGNCIINTYEDNKLVFIMDAIYDKGKLISYKQVLKNKTLREEDVWIVSERISEGDYNSGNTWTYAYIENYEKAFVSNLVVCTDIITADNFRKNIAGYLEGYYHGNTSEGYYNDTTGDAFLIKFSDDGTVRTLYSGNFSNGEFEDDTKNAWYITKEDNTDYMYYIGIFEKGHPSDESTEKNFKNHLSIDDINQIIGDQDFNINLVWKFS